MTSDFSFAFLILHVAVAFLVLANVVQNNTGSFFNRTVGNIDNLAVQAAHNALCIGQLLVDAVHIRIYSGIAQSHGL